MTIFWMLVLSSATRILGTVFPMRGTPSDTPTLATVYCSTPKGGVNKVEVQECLGVSRE